MGLIRWRARAPGCDLGRWLRVVALLMGLQICVALGGMGRARADVNRALEEGGRALLSQSWISGHASISELELNGLKILAQSSRSPLSVAAVVAELESRCDRQQGQSLASAGEDSGTVICLRPATARVPATDRIAAPSRLLTLMNLAQLSLLGGSTRVAFELVQRGDGQTALLSLRPQGSLDISAMFPARGDAPGVDLVNFPRPRGGRRTLSAQMARATLVLYEFPLGPAALRSLYAGELLRGGWRLGPGDSNVELAPLIAQRQGRTVALGFAEGAVGASSGTVAELP